MLHPVADMTMAALRESGSGALRSYERCLHSACIESPPPFGTAWYGDGFRQLAMNPYWLIQSLVSNATKEAEGASELWEISGRIDHPAIGEMVRVHAVDESRHARFYIAALELAFPSAIEMHVLKRLQRISPGYVMTDHPPAGCPLTRERIVDLLIQTNVGEIRTRIHQLLLRPVLQAYCPEENCELLTRLLDSLLEDETRHIRYTAGIIDAAASEDPIAIATVFKHRLAQFNQLTRVEVGNQIFQGT